jgi:hypothetical protein
MIALRLDERTKMTREKTPSDGEVLMIIAVHKKGAARADVRAALERKGYTDLSPVALGAIIERLVSSKRVVAKGPRWFAVPKIKNTAGT